MKDLNLLNTEYTESLPRGYLGLSNVGIKCLRKLQYNHYWAYTSKLSARLRRLFDVGHDAEDKMIADLEKCGIIVTDRQESIVATAGHWRGHTDGKGVDNDSGESFLIEFKTHNDKSFAGLLKEGMKKSKAVHYAQMTSYMGYLNYKKGLYMALNKNDSTYYFEWVDFDKEYFDDLKRKENEVLMAEVLLPKIGTGKSTWYECKMCSANEVCYKKKATERNCRTCQHVDVLDDGQWGCSNKLQDLNTLSLDDQREGCYLYILGEIFK